MAATVQRVVLHVDMDAFFASVEQRDNPQWRGKPLVVGALPGNRGVVAAASYEARRFGIHSAMPIALAWQRCPQAIFVQPSHERYHTESLRIMSVLAGFSPVFEQVSVDEAFLDITGTHKLWGPPREVACRIRTQIRETTGLTASVGIAPNKFLAKIASDCTKPNGVTEVPFEPQAIEEWLEPLLVRKMWGVGEKTAALLERRGIRTIGDLQRLSLQELIPLAGNGAAGLYELCRGRDDREVEPPRQVKSVSREHTFAADTGDRGVVRKTLLTLSQDVGRQVRRAGLKGRTVVLTWRGEDFSRHSRRRTLMGPIDTAHELYGQALALLEALPPRQMFRLIGIGLCGFNDVDQLSLFGTDPRTLAWQKSERAVDQILERFGDGAVRRGGEG